MGIDKPGTYTLSFEVKGVLRDFVIVVSSEKPKTVVGNEVECFSATVDENGWVVGERTAEEAARRPSIYRRACRGAA